jgi:tetratricopeptide (TPR) repeat protein
MWLGGFLALAQPSLPKTSKPAQTPKSRREAADLPESHPAKTGDAASGTNAADPVEAEYQKLLDDDDKAQEEVDRWIQDNQKFAKEGAGVSNAELNQRIRGRLEPVRKGYEDFLRRHPNHVSARIAYGSFLSDVNDEEGEQVQLEKALALDTNNPAIYNNLANINGHIGDVKKAFGYYEKAIQLNPREPVYYHNFGTTVFLFRKDAREYYHIEEQQVFDKALSLYSNAMRLDPENFPLATDIAMTYYGIKPPRTDEALGAWTNALRLAHDELEREGVYIHFARVKLHAGRFEEARAHLAAITNEFYAELKQKLGKNIQHLEQSSGKPDSAETKGTNSGGGGRPLN